MTSPALSWWILGEVLGPAAEDGLDVRHDLGIAAVERPGEQVLQQPHQLVVEARLAHFGEERARRNRPVADVPAVCRGDLGDSVGEGEQPRPGELVSPVSVSGIARAPPPRRRRRRRRSRKARQSCRREGQARREDSVQESPLAKVLREPRGPQDGVVDRRSTEPLLAGNRTLLSPARQKDDVLQAALRRGGGEGRDIVGCARHGYVGLIGDVGGSGTAQGAGPGSPVGPIETGFGRARDGIGIDAPRTQL